MDLSKEMFLRLPDKYKALAIKLCLLGKVKIDYEEEEVCINVRNVD